MPITVDWGNLEENIIVWKFRNKWTEQEFYDAVNHSSKLTRSKPHPVDYIIDLRQSMSSPKNLITAARNAIDTHATSNEGLTTVITTSRFWERLCNTVIGTIPNYRGHIVFVGSVDEAYDTIDAQKATRDTDTCVS